MIIPPCKKNGVDCPRRAVGCQSSCPEMPEYYEKLQAAQKAEKQDRIMAAYRNEAAARIRKSNGCVPKVILKDKIRRQGETYGKNKVIKKDKP